MAGWVECECVCLPFTCHPNELEDDTIMSCLTKVIPQTVASFQLIVTLNSNSLHVGNVNLSEADSNTGCNYYLTFLLHTKQEIHRFACIREKI